jgi:hypothetical protein
VGSIRYRLGMADGAHGPGDVPLLILTDGVPFICLPFRIGSMSRCSVFSRKLWRGAIRRLALRAVQAPPTSGPSQVPATVLVNSVSIAVIALIAVLLATGTKYETYFQGAQFVHFLLGPATVALAVPLYNNFSTVKRLLVPMMVALVAGSSTAVISAVGIAWAAGADSVTLKSLAAKSVTTPIVLRLPPQLPPRPFIYIDPVDRRH